MLKPTQSLHVRLIRHLREWHRKLGIIAAFLLIFLSVSGIAINHSHSLSLDSWHVKSAWLLNFYGIKAPTDIRFYGKNNLFVTDQLLWFKQKLLLESLNEAIIGVGKFKQFWLVVTTQQLYLFSMQGELVDQLDSASGVPMHISAMNISANHLLLNTSTGYFQTDADFLDWQKVNLVTVPVWLTANQVKDERYHQAKLLYKSQYLTWERVLLDLHSGRIFGMFGIILSDIIAIILILLSMSGLYIWLRYAKNKR